jgi:hypothetical protein
MQPLRSPGNGGAARRAGLDYTAQIRRVTECLIADHDDLRHVDLSRVAFSFSRARQRGVYGIYASLTPLRFEQGSPVGKRRGRRYTVQKLYDDRGVEMLYILSVYLPRFADLSLREKVITLYHELWHISPRFDGDIRRHPGRCYAHSHSKAEYDEHMGRYADAWLQGASAGEHLEFLQCDFDALHKRHGRLFGTRIPRPKLIPVVDGRAAS